MPHRNRNPLATVLLLLGLSSCGENEQQAGAPPQQQAPEVGVTTVQPSDVPVTYEYAGRVAGVREVEVRARVTGILLERTYVEGSMVKAGDLLFRIDPAPFEVALAQAQASLEQARARLLQAERDNERIQALFKRGNASAKSRDDALAAYELAKGELAAAEAEVRSAQINLDYTRVEAPISGVTSLEAVSEGSLVGSSPDTSLLTTISQVDPVYVNFAVPEQEMAAARRQLESGQLATKATDGQLPVQVLRSDGRVHPQEGRINFFETGVDEQTGTIRVRAEVPNPDSNLLPGQFVRVVVEGLTLPNALAVPAEALMQGPQGPFLYVVGQDGRVEARPITPGRVINERLAVTEGLKPGDRVITEGVIKARPGQPVQVGTDPATAANDEGPTAGSPTPAAQGQSRDPERPL